MFLVVSNVFLIILEELKTVECPPFTQEDLTNCFKLGLCSSTNELLCQNVDPQKHKNMLISFYKFCFHSVWFWWRMLALMPPTGMTDLPDESVEEIVDSIQSIMRSSVL